MRLLMPGHAHKLMVVALAATVFVCTGQVMAHAPSQALKEGMMGDEVLGLQEMLTSLGFYGGECDGVFGGGTMRAVRAFQREYGLGVDGVVGASTWDRLESELARARMKTYVVRPGDSLWTIAAKFGVGVQDIARANEIPDPSVIRVGQELRVPGAGDIPSRGDRSPVEALHWDKARNIFRSYATVIDVRTGLAFRVKRRGGHYHADVEPVSSEDTAIMRRVYGGRWSWARRPIIVEVGDRRIAASMNGMPHGGQSLRGNGFPGHFCIHFAGSRLHGSGKVDPEHQACVRKAASGG